MPKVNKKEPPCYSESLAGLFEEIAEEWDIDMNKNGPEMHRPNERGESVYWKCRNNWRHKWKSTIYARTKQNSSCPYCSGKEMTPEQSIAVTHKHIIDKEWDYVNNKNIKPEQFKRTSKTLVWWMSLDPRTGLTTRYQQKIFDKCPPGPLDETCGADKKKNEKSLLVTHPQIAKFWDKVKNDKEYPGDTPSTVTSLSKKKSIRDRVSQRDACLVCKSIVCTHPNIAADFDTERNKADISECRYDNKTKKFWWKCSVAKHPSYKAFVSNKIKNGCKLCSKSKL